ncbi:SAM-dependent methyltransferase [Halarchaeum grantii]|uniref:SAM-dependent methyltransferase n=1 Tax=Halarchaeum grantii TaxID=1193105 RepID=A0A830FBC6_9EURY|nr:class I SAM-dependent methyltransferase family protein [Halarchaeum grantii]GGL29721.1 SAM-dependent methyltransferase [Halarchaeum grantii]
MNRLAVVVPKAQAEAKLETLEAEGVYDDSRRVRAHDDDRVELPVLAEPRATTFDAILTQEDPAVRTASLDDYLRERGWGAEEIERAPASWAVVGDVILVSFPPECPDRAAVGDALLELHGEADTVLARGGVAGETREPAVEVVAGSGDTETVHTEHGTRYALDLAEVMFAPGNQAERVRMGEVVSEGERVLDMFAGIGYFALPMARAGADVVAVEKNPAAFRYLAENAQLNGVAANVECVLGDCREYDATEPFERVVMGYYDSLGGHVAGGSEATDRGTVSGETANGATTERREGVAERASGSDDDTDLDPSYLAAAFDALDGAGTVHVHTTCHEPAFPERAVGRVEAVAEECGVAVEIAASRAVKSHSEGVVHGVLDVEVG